MIPLRPIGNKVVIRRFNEKEQTKGGIYIPGAHREKEIEGEVVAVGPGMVFNGKFYPTRVNIGDVVIFPKMNSQEFIFNDIEYVIVPEIELFGKFKSF